MSGWVSAMVSGSVLVREPAWMTGLSDYSRNRRCSHRQREPRRERGGRSVLGALALLRDARSICQMNSQAADWKRRSSRWLADMQFARWAIRFWSAGQKGQPVLGRTNVRRYDSNSVENRSELMPNALSKPEPPTQAVIFDAPERPLRSWFHPSHAVT